MRTREWSVCLVLAGLAVACGDQPTAPDREPTPGPGKVALATATSEDGLSIVTDKDDYAPGDTVWFTGAGWTPGDSLDVVLTDDPTLDSHQWAVGIREDGTFRDSTYVVDTEDLGVTFTLTATSRVTGRTLTVVFTDNRNISIATVNGGSTVTVAPGATITASVTVNTTSTGGGGENWFSTSWQYATTNPPATFNSPCVDTPDHAAAGSFTETFTTTAPSSPGTYNAYFLAWRTAGCANNPSNLFILTNAVTVVASAAATTTAVSSSQNPSGSGQSVTFTATVTSGSPAAAVSAGQVTFKSGGTNCADATELQAGQPLDGNGQVTFTTSALAIGSHTIRACYGGATGFLASTGSVTQQVNTTATAIGLASSANPSKTGQSVTFTATVTSNSLPVTSGQLSFKKGGTQCSDATEVQPAGNLDANGQKTYTASFAASQSPITIWACYGGSSSPLLSASEASTVQNVNKAATTTSVSSGLNPSVFSQSVTFTATVSVVAPGVGTPAGSIMLKDGTCAAGADLGTSSLNGSGQATFTVASLSAGSHAVTACYAGNDDFAASDGFVSQTVNQAATTTALSSSANPSVFSQAVTFGVTVTPTSPAVATPVGNVVLKNGSCAAGTTIGAATALDGSGKTSFMVSNLAVNTHTITACYLGAANFLASDEAVSQVVNKASTSTAVSSGTNPSVYSQSVTFTATVTPVTPATATPTGAVSFEEGGTACGNGTTVLTSSVVLNSSGQASFSTSGLAAGSHTIRACYAETGDFLASGGSLLQTVSKASTTTAVESSVSPSSLLNQPVTFTVTVASVSPATATPVGNVTLKDGTCAAGTTIGSATALDGSGQASFSVSTLSVGSHTVSACYAGADNFESSDGSASQQVRYDFAGFFAPVDRPNTFNMSKAGQAIPLKWHLQDFNGNPVTNLAAVTVKASAYTCDQGVSTDMIEEYASGSSGLQNLGGGNYQFNWKTPVSYASSCKTIGLDLGEGTVRTGLALFTFKK